LKKLAKIKTNKEIG